MAYYSIIIVVPHNTKDYSIKQLYVRNELLHLLDSDRFVTEGTVRQYRKNLPGNLVSSLCVKHSNILIERVDTEGDLHKHFLLFNKE